VFDLGLLGGNVIDGTGSQPFKGDIAIKDGNIEYVGQVDPAKCKQAIDVSGLIVSPGFIDMHSHSDLKLFMEPVALHKVKQGITTELLGQDGLGVAPVNKKHITMLAELVSGLLGSLSHEKWGWDTFSSYLKALESCPLPNNVAVLASHGPIRMAAMDMSDRKASAEEMDVMTSVLNDAMHEGAFGLSTGLIYPPCSFASTNELLELTKEVEKNGGIFVVHLRDEGFYLKEALNEMLQVCGESGAHLHVSHLQAYGQANWKNLVPALEMITDYSQKNNISFDRYPYLAGSTVLTAVLPAWVLEGGGATCLQRLEDPALREKIHREFDKGLEVWHNRSISVGWGKIVVCSLSSEKNKWMEGLSIKEISGKVNKNPIDTVCDLLLDEKLDVTMISHYGSEDNLKKVLTHTLATLGTDGIFSSKPHPRLYGTYPRFLGKYVRDEGILTLPEAVRKITSHPASILGLKDRGFIKEGYQADITVFDESSIIDTGSYENPHLEPEGITHVFVNGVQVINKGEEVNVWPGRVLEK